VHGLWRAGHEFSDVIHAWPFADMDTNGDHHVVIEVEFKTYLDTMLTDLSSRITVGDGAPMLPLPLLETLFRNSVYP
jgi:hypothetical protein